MLSVIPLSYAPRNVCHEKGIEQSEPQVKGARDRGMAYDSRRLGRFFRL